MLPLENIFNYLPSELRNIIQDDEQIKSWAFQFRTKIPNLGFTSYEVKPIVNHRIEFPEDYTAITGVYYSDKDECPIDVSQWCPMQRSSLIEPCLDNQCLGTFTITAHNIFSNYSSGFALIEYEAAFKQDGEYLFPSEPFELWQAMSHHVMSQYFLSKSLTDRSMYALYEREADKARNFLVTAINHLAIKNIRWDMMEHILKRRILNLDERTTY